MNLPALSGHHRAQLSDAVGRAMASAAPAMRSVVQLVGEHGESALDDRMIDTLCGLVHPLLPFPVQMIVNRSRLAAFIQMNRSLVVEAARRASTA